MQLNEYKGVEIHMKARGAVLSRRHAHSATVSDWSLLQPGTQVEIRQHAQIITQGVVEEVSQSGNVLWLVPVTPAEKQVFLKSDGVQVRRA